MKKLNKLIALALTVVMLGTTVLAAVPASAAAPTSISSPEQFNAISDGGSYKLTADITVSGASLTKKTGITLDGDGHTITLASTKSSALFARLVSSTVKNLTIKSENDAVLTFNASGQNDGVGSLAGTVEGACTLTNIINRANITTTTASKSWFGGIVGNAGNNNGLSANGTVFTNCINYGNLTNDAGEYFGGIVGVSFHQITYNGCANYGTLSAHSATGNNYIGGIIGFVYSGNAKASLINCIGGGSLSAAGGSVSLGGLVGHNSLTSYVKEVKNCVNVSNIPESFGKNPVNFTFSEDKTISNASQLSTLASGNIYTLTADIECAGGYTLPDNTYINGNGKTITLKNATSGLFKTAANTGIMDLTIAGSITVSANGTGAVGALINNSNGMLVLSGIKSSVSITVSGTGYSAVGGLVGAFAPSASAKINVANSASSGDINVTSRVESIGGIIGSINASSSTAGFDGATNAGEITASDADNVGGVIGYLNSSVATVEECANDGAITANTNGAGIVGGIVGTAAASADMPKNSNNGLLKGKYAGGILGKAASTATAITITDANNFASALSPNAAAVAGICGLNEISTALTVTTSKDHSNDISVKAATIALDGKVSMYFYIGNAAFSGASEIKASTEAGDKIELLNKQEMINGVLCRIYCIPNIEPTRFNETIKFTVSMKKNGQPYSETLSYSVKDYCMDKVGEDDTLTKLLVDLILYAAEAEKAAGKTQGLITEGMSNNLLKSGTTITPVLDKTNEYTGTVNAEVAEWKGAEIAFDKGLTATLKFSAKNGINGMSAKILCGKNAVLTVNSFNDLGNGLYSFELTGLSAEDFKTSLKITLNNASGESQAFVFSVDAFAAEVMKGEDDAEIAEAALKYINSIMLYINDVTKYDIEKYAAPIWEGDIVYAESAFIRENAKDDPSVAPITLLYPIDEIISVRSSDMKKLYKEGKDYEVKDGKLIIKTQAEGGSIRILPFYSADTNVEAWTYSAKGTYTGDSMLKNGVYYYYRDPMYTTDTEGGIVKWNISVTYKHSGTSIVTTPTDQSDKFEGLMDKLVAGNELKVVSLGDSITEGCSASANHKAYGGFGGTGWGPAAPAYNVMFCDYLEAAYGVTTEHINFAISGSTAKSVVNSNGLYAGRNMVAEVSEENPDIFIIAYGMNDGGESTANEAGYIKTIVDGIKANCPDTYVIVVSTCLLGQQYSATNANRLYFGDAFEEVFKNEKNVVVANVTKADIEMQGYDVVNQKDHTGPKSYQDVTGSNSNHPNDFMHRVYLQVMIQSAFGENKFAK